MVVAARVDQGLQSAEVAVHVHGHLLPRHWLGKDPVEDARTAILVSEVAGKRFVDQVSKRIQICNHESWFCQSLDLRASPDTGINCFLPATGSKLTKVLGRFL